MNLNKLYKICDFHLKEQQTHEDEQCSVQVGEQQAKMREEGSSLVKITLLVQQTNIAIFLKKVLYKKDKTQYM